MITKSEMPISVIGPRKYRFHEVRCLLSLALCALHVINHMVSFCYIMSLSYITPPCWNSCHTWSGDKTTCQTINSSNNIEQVGYSARVVLQERRPHQSVEVEFQSKNLHHVFLQDSRWCRSKYGYFPTMWISHGTTDLSEVVGCSHISLWQSWPPCQFPHIFCACRSQLHNQVQAYSFRRCPVP